MAWKLRSLGWDGASSLGGMDVNNKFSYFYLHLSMYHLEEIVIANGHPLAGDDSILEKGNHNLGKFKSMVFHTKGEEEQWVRLTRKRLGDEGEEADIAMRSQSTKKSVYHGASHAT